MKRIASVPEVYYVRAHKASEQLADAREGARGKVVAGIRAIESKLKRLVVEQEQPLKGLRDITGGAQPRFFGVRVGTREPSEVIPADGRAVLALSASGELWMVTRHGKQVSMRKVEDDELMAEDLERIAKLVVDVLRRHAAHVSARADFYSRTVELAHKIEEALSD